MESNFQDPINLGSDEMVSINEMVDIVELIAGIELEKLPTRCPKRCSGTEFG